MNLSTLARPALRALPLLAALAAPAALAGPSGVPFSGTFTTQEKVGFTPRCAATGGFGGTTTGEGHASHLGAATGIASDCITMSPTTGPTSFSNGNLVLTAANGDQLHVLYSGNLAPTQTPPIAKLVGTYRIDGGTGRFAQATGSGTVSGIENILTGQGQLGLDGTISY